MDYSFVYATEEFEAYHKWDGAPEETKFLRSLHRHIFKVKVYISVDRDREIEFIDLKWKIRDYIRGNFEMKEVGSCESIGEEIKRYVESLYPGKIVVVDVSEDGENGVIV